MISKTDIDLDLSLHETPKHKFTGFRDLARHLIHSSGGKPQKVCQNLNLLYRGRRRL